VIQNQGQTEELRTRVLTRLSLFLHEHGHHRAAVDYSWMETSGNFIVQVAQRIHLTKQLRFHSVNSSKTLDASAAVTRASRNGPITLWISGEVDMYEYVSILSSFLQLELTLYFVRVANALLSVILRNHKVNDALLFSTILSTDLRSLRRRGYNGQPTCPRSRRKKRVTDFFSQLTVFFDSKGDRKKLLKKRRRRLLTRRRMNYCQAALRKLSRLLLLILRSRE
jgi:hypothetical protein